MLLTCKLDRNGKDCGGEITPIIGDFSYVCQNPECCRKYAHAEIVWMLKQQEKKRK